MSQQALDLIAKNRETHYPALNLSFCSVTDELLRQLTDHVWLQQLNLWDNQVSDLGPLATLTNLQQLDLGNNQVSDQTQVRRIIALPKLEEINLRANPLSLPTALLKDLGGLRAHFADLDKGVATRQSVKLLFLGDGCAGKSTLYQHLRLGTSPPPIPPEQRTHGIALDTWADDLPNVDIQVWDFGGQDIFHGTHRLFLGQQAVYVLVWTKQENKKCTEGEQHPLRYWLDFIADYGRHSTVLLVENIIDGQFDSTEFPDDTLLEQLVQEYKERAITLVPTHHRIDCLHDTDAVLDFKATLQRRIKTLLQQHSEGDTPANRYAVQQALIAQRQTAPTLPKTGYEALCLQHDITDSEAFLRFLHHTGVVSYYEDLFNNQIILQTDWLFEAMYALLRLTDNPLARLHGKLTEADFEQVWSPTYTPDEQRLFRDYMLKSELIAKPFRWHTNEVKRTYQYLVPALFPPAKAHEKIGWGQQGRYVVVRFRFAYRAIIQRLQVRVLTHCHVEEEETLFQNRISFTDRAGNVAHIELLEAEKELRIWAETDALYSQILAELDDIYPLERVTLLERQPGQPDRPLPREARHRHDEQGFARETDIPMTAPITIFVTYAWNDANGIRDTAHQAQVRAFVDALNVYGSSFDATFDLYENDRETATDFNKMMLSNMSSRQKVIAVLSDGYAQTADAFERSIGGVEYPAILSHIRDQPQKFCLVAFAKPSLAIYPYGLAARDTVTILNGELEAPANEDEKNRLFAKLKNEALYPRPPKGSKSAIVQTK
jgi:GTPase SAR1 family protein